MIANNGNHICHGRDSELNNAKNASNLFNCVS